MAASLLQIVSSWFAFSQGEPYTKALMRKRLAICDTCTNKEALSSTGEVLLKVLTDDEDLFYRCGVCKCPLAGLTAGSTNQCPIGKWKRAGEESYF